MTAASPAELLALIVPGYTDHVGDQARFRARVDLALCARRQVQALLNAGELFEDNTPDEARLLLQGGDRPVAPVEWHSPIPLVLVSSFYRPTGALAQPHTFGPGQVWWIDPSSAATLLETLHQVHWLDVVSLGGAARTGHRTHRNLGYNGAAGYWWRTLPAQVPDGGDLANLPGVKRPRVGGSD